MWSTELFAYIDPVSGSILLQLLFVGIIGVTGFLVKPLRSVISRLRHPESRSREENNKPPSQESPSSGT